MDCLLVNNVNTVCSRIWTNTELSVSLYIISAHSTSVLGFALPGLIFVLSNIRDVLVVSLIRGTG